MQKHFVLAATVLASLLPAVTGHAQLVGGPTVAVQKPATVKLGLFFPTSSDARDAVGKTWFTAGADYAFRKTDAAAPVLPLIYVDYAGKNKNGLSLSSVGVGLGVRAYGNRATNTKVVPFYGAGIGAYFLHGSGGGTSENKTRFGGKINAGVELNQGPFLEAAYTLTGKVAGDDLNGVSVLIGDRF